MRYGYVNEDDKLVELLDEGGDYVFDRQQAVDIAKLKHNTDNVYTFESFRGKRSKQKRRKEKGNNKDNRYGYVNEDGKLEELLDEGGDYVFDRQQALDIAKLKHNTDKVYTFNSFRSTKLRKRKSSQKPKANNAEQNDVLVENNVEPDNFNENVDDYDKQLSRRAKKGEIEEVTKQGRSKNNPSHSTTTTTTVTGTANNSTNSSGLQSDDGADLIHLEEVSTTTTTTSTNNENSDKKKRKCSHNKDKVGHSTINLQTMQKVAEYYPKQDYEYQYSMVQTVPSTTSTTISGENNNTTSTVLEEPTNNHNKISQLDVIIKEEPALTQHATEQSKICPITQLDLNEAQKVARTLRGTSKAQYNCPQLSFGFLKYLLTGEKPTEQASTRAAKSKDIQMGSYYKPIKSEHGVYAQVSSLRMTHTGNDFPAPYTSEICYEETQDGGMALDLSLEKYVLDDKHLEKIHYKELPDFLKRKASGSGDQTSRGLIFLPEVNKIKYVLVYKTEKDKPGVGHIEFTASEQGFEYRFTQNDKVQSGSIGWGQLPSDMPKDNNSIYYYQLNILPFILKHLGIGSNEMPGFGDFQGHQLTYIADTNTVWYVDLARFKADTNKKSETSVEEYIYQDIEKYYLFLNQKNISSYSDETIYGTDVFVVSYPTRHYAKKNEANSTRPQEVGPQLLNGNYHFIKIKEEPAYSRQDTSIVPLPYITPSSAVYPVTTQDTTINPSQTTTTTTSTFTQPQQTVAYQQDTASTHQAKKRKINQTQQQAQPLPNLRPEDNRTQHVSNNNYFLSSDTNALQQSSQIGYEQFNIFNPPQNRAQQPPHYGQHQVIDPYSSTSNISTYPTQYPKIMGQQPQGQHLVGNDQPHHYVDYLPPSSSSLPAYNHQHLTQANQPLLQQPQHYHQGYRDLEMYSGYQQHYQQQPQPYVQHYLPATKQQYNQTKSSSIPSNPVSLHNQNLHQTLPSHHLQRFSITQDWNPPMNDNSSQTSVTKRKFDQW